MGNLTALVTARTSSGADEGDYGRLTVIHTYAIMRLYGDNLYQQNVDTLYDAEIPAGQILPHLV